MFLYICVRPSLSLWKIAWYLFFTNIKRFLSYESQTFWRYNFYTRIKTNCVLIVKIRIFRIFTILVLTLSFDQVKLERWRLSAERYATCINLLTYIYAIKFTFVQNPSDFFIFLLGKLLFILLQIQPYVIRLVELHYARFEQWLVKEVCAWKKKQIWWGMFNSVSYVSFHRIRKRCFMLCGVRGPRLNRSTVFHLLTWIRCQDGKGY